MPQLGMFMTAGIIGQWLVDDGVQVKRGDSLVEIQNEKVVHTIEAPNDGTVQQVAKEGEELPVSGVIGYILPEGEKRKKKTGQPYAGAASPGNTSPAGVSPGYTSEKDTNTPGPPADQLEVRASPIARKLAEKNGIDLRVVKGSGPRGRVVEKDIMAVVEKEKTQSLPSVLEAHTIGVDSRVAPVLTDEETDQITAVGDVSPLRGTRKIIFERMGMSHRSAARVTEFIEVDATKLVALRTRLNAETERFHKVKIGYNDLLLLLAARTLQKHLFMNITLTNEGILTQRQINIGLAVETENGLIVPVIRGVEKLRLLDIARKARELIDRARTGMATTEDLSGGTFTITNLGMHDIDGFTPIINPPESAILGVGRIAEKPVVYNKEITIRQMMILSLTFDHRIIDGGPAARFLKSLKKLIEEPMLSLV